MFVVASELNAYENPSELRTSPISRDPKLPGVAVAPDTMVLNESIKVALLSDCPIPGGSFKFKGAVSNGFWNAYTFLNLSVKVNDWLTPAHELAVLSNEEVYKTTPLVISENTVLAKLNEAAGLTDANCFDTSFCPGSLASITGLIKDQ